MKEQALLQLTITQVDAPVFSGEVRSVRVPGTEGAMEILANHEPLISPLTAGTLVVIAADGAETAYEVSAGTLEVSDNHATILI